MNHEPEWENKLPENQNTAREQKKRERPGRGNTCDSTFERSLTDAVPW